MSRQHSDRPSNATFEGLFQRIGSLEGQVAGMRSQISAIRGNASLTMPTPTLPFKIAEEGTNQGILITVGVNLPGQNYDIIRGSLIRVFDNTKKAGETDAQAIARAITKIKKFKIEVKAKDIELGVAIRQLEELPLQPQDDPTKNQYQLIELVAVNKDGSARVTNPADDPTKTFPFPALTVDNPGIKFFTIGNSPIGEGPSAPDKSRIVENKVYTASQAADALVTFKLIASATDPLKTFGDLGITAAYIGIRPFADADDTTGETDNKFRPGGPIADTTKTFTLISVVLPLGDRFKWNRTITMNAAGKNVTLAASTIDFYAGGDPPTNGIPEIKSFTLAVTPKQNDHSLMTVLIEQFPNGAPPTGRAFAALLKKLSFIVREPGGVDDEVYIVDLLKEEATFIQGNTVSFKHKVNHKANQTGIKFNAKIFGITHTPSNPIVRNATEATGDSTLNAVPTAVLTATSPDDDTSDATDAFADFTISLVSGQTFATAGVDSLIVKIRKANNSSDDDPNDNRVKQIPFSLEVDELNSTSVVKRVRDLKFARRYEVNRVFSVRAGTNVRSAALGISFRAGLGLLDPAAIGIVGTAAPNKKRDAIVTASVTQTNPPVFLKECLIMQDQLDGQGFVEVKAVNLKNKNRFQKASTQIAQPQTFKRKVHTPANVPGIKYKLVVVAVGELTKESAEFIQAATNAEAPTDAPSVPTPNDIIFNTIHLDPSLGQGKTTFQVFADQTRTKTFAQTLADKIRVVLADQADAGNATERYNFDVDVSGLNATSIIVEATSLVAGKVYLWRKNVALRNGIPAKSGVSDVVFISGGPVGTTGSPGLPELTDLSVVLSQVLNNDGKPDARHIVATPFFTQSKVQSGTGTITKTATSTTVTGSGTAFLTQLRFHYQITILGETRRIVGIINNNNLLVDLPFNFSNSTAVWTFTPPIVFVKRAIPFLVRTSGPQFGVLQQRQGERVLDMPGLQTAGIKSFPLVVHTPNKTNFSITVRVLAVGDNFVDISSTGMVSPTETSFDDAGKPNGVSQVPRMRWREGNSGNGGFLRTSFKLDGKNPGDAISDNGNLNTHVTNKLLFYFLVSGVGTWLWNPVERTSLFLGAGFNLIDPLNQPSQQGFLIDIGKQVSLSLPNHVPKSATEGAQEIDSSGSLYNTLSVNFSTINCRLYAFNKFADILNGTEFGTAGNIQTTPSGSTATGFSVFEFSF